MRQVDEDTRQAARTTASRAAGEITDGRNMPTPSVESMTQTLVPRLRAHA